jgi:putative membrane protein
MNFKIVWLIVFGIGLCWSGFHPHDQFTWFLEVFPAIVAVIILALTYHKFHLTTITYVFILIHCYVLFIGGHYTYAEVPAFDWIKEVFHQSRNNYDKVGHFTQGFVPALVVREVLLRNQVVKRGLWLMFIVVCICVSISVWYEFLEWFVAVQTGESAEAFLGTQGYAWDTQSDMLYAMIGALTSLLLLSKVQDRQM